MTKLRQILLLFVLSLPLVATAQGIAVGEPALPLSLPNLPSDGQSTSLSALRGNIVYLDFWASWCGPCRMSFPQLDQLRRELGASGFEVLAVNVDEFEDDALGFLDDIPVSYPVVRDGSGQSPEDWGIRGMPTGFLIDRNGVVRKIHQGYRRSDGESLRAEIVQLLGE